LSAKRTTISISHRLYAKAQELMKLRDYDDFAGFLQQLIREEYHRRVQPLPDHDLADKERHPSIKSTADNVLTPTKKKADNLTDAETN
jgi:uncharacterized membrane protein YheB (UPF0754 family)